MKITKSVTFRVIFLALLLPLGAISAWAWIVVTVPLSSPPPNSSYTAPATIILSVNSTWVRSANYFANGAFIGSSTGTG